MRTESQNPIKKKPAAARAKPSHEDGQCVLCGGTIERFDREIYVLTARCAPCHEALEQN